MDINKWIQDNTLSLSGKSVAVTGTTGGLGKELCHHLAALGANLILLDRNKERSDKFRDELVNRHSVSVKCINVDLADFKSVKNMLTQLMCEVVDIFIHNAGAYSIPRKKTDLGYDNVFQINFVSPYYIIRTLLPKLRERGGRVVVVGSIAHNYSKIDINDIDFSTRKAASKVYGNAKRFLMFSLYELFKDEKNVSLAVTHPGITFTNITAHYPKLIYAVIKHPMKLIFMKPKKAALSILSGVFVETEHSSWIGPKWFDIWGLPKKKTLKTVKSDELENISKISEEVYKKASNFFEEIKI